MAIGLTCLTVNTEKNCYSSSHLQFYILPKIQRIRIFMKWYDTILDPFSISHPHDPHHISHSHSIWIRQMAKRNIYAFTPSHISFPLKWCERWMEEGGEGNQNVYKNILWTYLSPTSQKENCYRKGQKNHIKHVLVRFEKTEEKLDNNAAVPILPLFSFSVLFLEISILSSWFGLGRSAKGIRKIHFSLLTSESVEA